jgi:hypothetical protein
MHFIKVLRKFSACIYHNSADCNSHYVACSVVTEPCLALLCLLAELCSGLFMKWFLPQYSSYCFNLLLDPLTQYGRFYSSYFVCHSFYLVAVAQLVEALRYKPEGGGFDSVVSSKFFIDIILPTALWSWGRLSL